MLENYLPQKLKLSIGGYFGSSYLVKWENNILIYIKKGKDMKKEICLTPSWKDWKKFWERLSELNVWEWKERYSSQEAITDGVSWKIIIEYKDQKLNSSGENAFPPAGNFSSEKFSCFCSAVSKLCGGRDFE